MSSPNNRLIIQGTCGWSDEGLSRRFFSSNHRSSCDRLRYMWEQGLLCVEVNSSLYGIPQKTSVSSWAQSVGNGFIFHFKAFSGLCGSDIQTRQLSAALRDKHSISSEASARISLTSRPCLLCDVWEEFNACLQPAVDAEKMGCVVFQFHTNFSPCESSRKCVEQAASYLRPDVRMAVEFRDRAWIGWMNDVPCDVPDADGSGGNSCRRETLQSTLEWLKRLRPEGVVLIASDELMHETFPHSSYSSPANKLLPQLSESLSPHGTVLPTVLTARPCCHMAYIRIHRREGTHRTLSPMEVSSWVQRIENLMNESYSCECSSSLPNGTNTKDVNPTTGCVEQDGTRTLQGPCYVLWGTDYEDHPILNIRNLHEALPDHLRSRKVPCVQKGAIQSFFRIRPSKESANQKIDSIDQTETAISPPSQKSCKSSHPCEEDAPNSVSKKWGSSNIHALTNTAPKRKNGIASDNNQANSPNKVRKISSYFTKKT
mmetsp:Transcript_12364/g.18750  ORF Transcript_12364/g.18750 Transcript_12364/m.18750 type:complete len:486 (+) Transcript_12364:24-1481(+)